MAKKVTKSQAKKAKKVAKKHPKIIIAIAVLVLIIAIALIVLYFVKPDLYHKYLGIGDHTWNDDGVCTVCGMEKTGEGSVEEISSADLSIHFLELGNKYTGDCTLIKYGNTEILIDAGSRQNSATTIKNYVDQYCTDGVLEYVIATHAHQDHIAGFVGSNSGNTKTGILYQYKVGTLIQFAGTSATSEIYKSYCTAVEYAKNQGANVYTAKQCWYETDGAKKQYFLDDAQKVSLNILYQKHYDEATSDENDYSVCTLLTQVTENKTYNYLFTG
ncbi:MAG: MBL fold metallo-hydrolase, partial [Clostridia bacterium]|nr:MBL fold metallo-hydrolase [Clostridia bacterium]